MNSIVRRFERAPEMSDDGFRNAMRQLAGGVSIITAGSGETISGMTVTSLSSLSASPPRLMAAVNRQASSFPLIQRSGFFGISVLGARHRSIAERFSDRALKGQQRFANADWITLASGVPVLADALAAIDCEVEEIIERHSHAILIGRPLDMRTTANHSGLAYWQGQYAEIDHGRDNEALAEIKLTPQALWQV